ncbi:putative RNA methyltransferase [Platanthera guangdongensis]|uniref:RNA methyltransferase n=1 Tax=Platanthera guangdongensis TaxID=2320717 RepID=A0ABR2MBV9_9ASPA
MKKDTAAEKEDKSSRRLQKTKPVFVYGNYRKYYGYRLNHTMEEDPRLKVFKREWFENKDCLDIGCNQGLVTINIAKKFHCQSIVGIDIDRGLVEDAKCNLRNMARKKQSQEILGKVSVPDGSNQDLLQRVSFRCENFVDNMRGGSVKYDTILCLSVTKWIHLNWGDDGLVTLFVKMWRLLKPGGVLLLEPQPWTSYKNNRQVSEIGFRSADTITECLSGTVAGFDRPILVFQK